MSDKEFRNLLIELVNTLSEEQANLDEILLLLNHMQLLASEASSEYLTYERRQSIQVEFELLKDKVILLSRN